jgi:hypothetical protein
MLFFWPLLVRLSLTLTYHLFGCLTLKQVNTFFMAKNFYTSVIAITLITSC